MFTRDYTRSLSWARWNQSTPSHPTSLWSILILSSPSMFMSSTWSLPFSFSNRNTVRNSHLSRPCYMYRLSHRIKDNYLNICFSVESEVNHTNMESPIHKNDWTWQKFTRRTTVWEHLGQKNWHSEAVNSWCLIFLGNFGYSTGQETPCLCGTRSLITEPHLESALYNL